MPVLRRPLGVDAVEKLLDEAGETSMWGVLADT
jgi:hypothetical protein